MKYAQLKIKDSTDNDELELNDYPKIDGGYHLILVITNVETDSITATAISMNDESILALDNFIQEAKVRRGL